MRGPITIPTAGQRWSGGGHYERNIGSRVGRVLGRADREAAARQTADDQLPADADQRYRRKVDAETDRTQQLALLHNRISVVHTPQPPARQPAQLKPSYDLQQTWPPPRLRLLTSTK